MIVPGTLPTTYQYFGEIASFLLLSGPVGHWSVIHGPRVLVVKKYSIAIALLAFLF